MNDTNLKMFATIVVVLISGLSGCVFNAQVETVTRTVTHDGVDWTTFSADVVNGPIRVSGHDDLRADVIAELEAVVLDGDTSDPFDDVDLLLVVTNHVLRLGFAHADDLADAVSLESIRAFLPRQAWLDLEASNQDIIVSNMAGNVVARTSNGDLRVQTEGIVSLDTSNGRIDVQTGGGGRAETSNGKIFATVNEGDITALRLDTSNGDVYVYLPPAVGFHLDLETSNGELDLESLGFEIQGDSFSGPVYGGGPLVRVRTSNGDITIR